jgi:hypothetical protein
VYYTGPTDCRPGIRISVAGPLYEPIGATAPTFFRSRTGAS